MSATKAASSAKRTKRARHTGRRTRPCAAVPTALVTACLSPSRADDAHAARIGGAQAERAERDALDAGVQSPGARLELQASVLHVELARAIAFALEVREELACLVLGSDEPERAGDENCEEEEVQFRHRAPGSIRRLV